jgi:signal transduction histidine kinase
MTPPLSVVKLQAQLIADETDPKERRALTELLIAGVDRASTLTDNLLTLARLEARTNAAAGGDLRQETVGAIGDLAPLAEKHEVELCYEDDLGAPFSGDAVLLRLVATNLIENAIHHAPPHTEVAIRLWTVDGVHHLSVTDGGPGIPARERERVLRRFHQGEDAGSGSGLGLSIVVEALRLLNGHLRLLDRDDGRPGLHACVDLQQSSEHTGLVSPT